MERENNSEATGMQRKGRVNKAGQAKSMDGNQTRKTEATDAVAKGVVATSGRGKKRVAKMPQRQSIAKEHDDIVPSLLRYQSFQQKRMLFNYETAGPWFEEVRLRMCPHYTVMYMPHEPTVGTPGSTRVCLCVCVCACIAIDATCTYPSVFGALLGLYEQLCKACMASLCWGQCIMHMGVCHHESVVHCWQQLACCVCVYMCSEA